MIGANGAAQERGIAGLLAGILLAGIILCTGTLAAELLRRRGGELLAEQVFLQAGARTQNAEQLPRERTLELFKEYLFAFADAAIRFDTVPKFDTHVLYSIAVALPDGSEVTSMAFAGRNIVLECTALDPLQALDLAAALRAESRFESALAGPLLQTAEGLWAFTVTCVPRLEEGQLSMSEN